MRCLMFLLLAFVYSSAFAASPKEIIARNTRAIVYLQVEDASGGILDRGTGFIVSHEGHIITAAHIKVDPTQKLWAVIGQRQGTRFQLDFRDAEDDTDTALWQLPQSATCRYAVAMSDKPLQILDRLLVLGFPGTDGLSPANVSLSNKNGPYGFYKTDGVLRPGNSGGPIFNEDGQVVAFVHGGTKPGTSDNDIIPIALAESLLKKWGVNYGKGSPIPFEASCYASCRNPAHGVEKWQFEEPWGPANSGKLPGGHTRRDECNKLIAATLATRPGSIIELLPGEGTPDSTGMWETSEKNFLGEVSYIYYCKGAIRSQPVYAEKQSEYCGLWE